MNAFTKVPFGELAPYLADYGYQPVPIKPTFKAPMIDDWQAGHPPQHYLPQCRSWGTGILTATCPAIDLDIRDREGVRALLELAGDTLGPTPFRIGQPPKVLLPYSTSAPFDKISGRWWSLPGEDFRSDCYAPHRIEILGRGQQYVCYARHPRGTYYRWRRGEPMDTLLIDLPEIDEASAKSFLTTAERIIEDIGGIPLRRENKGWRPDLAQPEQFDRRRSNLNISSDWQRLDPESLAKRIDAGHARRIRNGWITACPAHKSEGGRSLSVTPRNGGGSLVHCFAECSFTEISREISARIGAV